MYSKVISVTHTQSYDFEVVSKSVQRHFENLKLNEIIRPDMKVLLKPNLLMKRKPQEATTTHPVIIEAIILCLKNLGVSDIVLADSPGGPYTRLAINGIYEATGMTSLARKTGITLNQDFGSFDRRCENGKAVQSFTLINPVKEADFIIDIAKLKTHAMTTLSGGVKNLFGTVPGLMKPEFHFRFPNREDFCNMLVDLCETVRPNVVFVDAICSMEGDGPSGGEIRETGLLLASHNPYHMDLALCKVIHVEPKEVLTIKIAMERGLSVKDFLELTLVGDFLPVFSDFKLPQSKSVDFLKWCPRWMQPILNPIAKQVMVSKPVIRKKQCIGCGKCAESCPAKIIDIVDKKAIIDYSKCIRCFCCHEMCPIKVIDIKRFAIFKL